MKTIKVVLEFEVPESVTVEDLIEALTDNPVNIGDMFPIQPVHVTLA